MSRQGEFRSPTFENIRAFWESEAAAMGETPQVTIRDIYFRIHELSTLTSLIPRTERLLDAGCGTGFGTLALSRRAQYTQGIDYSENMIRWALRLQTDPGYRARVSDSFSPLWGLSVGDGHELSFAHADVMNLQVPSPRFDVVAAQRLLINLPSHSAQLEALANLRRCSQDDGYLFLVEATSQGHARTDAYRAQYGLPPLEKYWHNCYVDEERLPEWRSVGWEVEQVLSFETYMLLSKVVYPAACGPDRCEFLSGVNAAAMETACLFRTRSAAQEVGERGLLNFFARRVQQYDSVAASDVSAWVQREGGSLPEWTRVGHQLLFVARAGS